MVSAERLALTRKEYVRRLDMKDGLFVLLLGRSQATLQSVNDAAFPIRARLPNTLQDSRGGNNRRQWKNKNPGQDTDV